MTIKEKAEQYFENECEHSYADNTEQLKEDVVLAFMKGAETALRMRMNTKTLKKLICDKEELEQKLEQAKDIIKDLLRLPYANDWEVCGDVTSYLDKAEQFIKEFEVSEDRLCEHCDQYKSCPDGKHCRTCDNGSNWKRRKEKKMNEYARMADRMYDLDKQLDQLEKENAELKMKIYGGGYEMIITKKDADIILLEKQLKEQKEHHKRVCESLTNTHRNLREQFTKARDLILNLYNAGRDVLMCPKEENVYVRLDNAINDKRIEQFLEEMKK